MVNARCDHIRRLDYLLTSGALQSMTELSLGAGGGNCTNACVSVIASIKNTLTPHKSRSPLLIPHNPDRHSTLIRHCYQSRHLTEDVIIAFMSLKRDAQELLPEPLSLLCVQVTSCRALSNTKKLTDSLTITIRWLLYVRALHFICMHLVDYPYQKQYSIMTSS